MIQKNGIIMLGTIYPAPYSRPSSRPLNKPAKVHRKKPNNNSTFLTEMDTQDVVENGISAMATESYPETNTFLTELPPIHDFKVGPPPTPVTEQKTVDDFKVPPIKNDHNMPNKARPHFRIRNKKSRRQKDTPSRQSTTMEIQPYNNDQSLPKQQKQMEVHHEPKPSMVVSMREGLQRAYMDGLEFMRSKIAETEENLCKAELAFYNCTEHDEDKFEGYLKLCNENFLMGNNELRRKNVKLQVIDSETKIIHLINKLREVAEVDKGEIAFLTEFWDHIKETVECLSNLLETFQKNVLERMNQNCISYNNPDIQLEVSNRYTEEISSYIQELEMVLSNTRILIKSYNNGLHQDLFSVSKFADTILVSCDLKAFPILRLVPDLSVKIHSLCDTSRKWLDRDEEYMNEVNNYIRETRSITRKREEDLRTRKEKQRKVEKAVKSAHILLHTNREKLQTIENELNLLEDQINGYRDKKKNKSEEKQQKESMVDFLKITLSQTKRNYNLQMKRQRLLKQVRELEKFLSSIERELSDVQDQVAVKSQEKLLLNDKVKTSQMSYGALKTDFEKMSNELEKLEQEVNGLSGQLLQLEIIQTFKTSPENVENIFDRPSTVKLAPSLKDAIQRKRRSLSTKPR